MMNSKNYSYLNPILSDLEARLKGFGDPFQEIETPICGWWERVKLVEVEEDGEEMLQRLVISARGTLFSFRWIAFFLFLFLKDEEEAVWEIEILLLQTGGTFSLLLWLLDMDMVEDDVIEVDSIAKNWNGMKKN